MPNAMERLFGMLGVPFVPGRDLRTWICSGAWDMRFVFAPGAPLFVRTQQVVAEEKIVEEKKIVLDVAEPEAPITIDEFARVQLHVGRIIAVLDIPESEKIYQMRVDFGPLGERTICAGVKKQYLPEDLRDRQAIFVTNLAPRRLLGVLSQGMMRMATDAEAKPQVVAPAAEVPNGTRLK
jgi:methionyl-tRNA synthetase